SSRRRHTRSLRDWSSDVCSSDLHTTGGTMIRKVVYFSMKVPNRPGIGLQVLKSIAMGKQNLLAFTGFPQGGKAQVDFVPANPVRSEERRVGKECSCRSTPAPDNK